MRRIKSLRDLLKGAPAEEETSGEALRRLAASPEPLMQDKTPEEAAIRSCLPGVDDPQEHVMERLFPTGILNLNPQEMKRRYLAGEVSEHDLRQYITLTGEKLFGADWEPDPDQGGEVVPYTGKATMPRHEEIDHVSKGGGSRPSKFPVIRID